MPSAPKPPPIAAVPPPPNLNPNANQELIQLPNTYHYGMVAQGFTNEAGIAGIGQRTTQKLVKTGAQELLPAGSTLPKGAKVINQLTPQQTDSSLQLLPLMGDQRIGPLKQQAAPGIQAQDRFDLSQFLPFTQAGPRLPFNTLPPSPK